MKYLAESRKNLKLYKGDLHSQFSLRVMNQQKHRTLLNLRNGTSIQHFVTNELIKNHEDIEEQKIASPSMKRQIAAKNALIK